MEHFVVVNEDTIDTLVVYLLDRSGSMADCLPQTISGFNEYIGSVRAGAKGNIRVTLKTFASAGFLSTGPITVSNAGDIQTIFDMVKLEDVPALSEANYVPNGGTPLYDAIGDTIAATDFQLSRLAVRPNVFFVVQTDGGENSSTKYLKSAINTLISARSEAGWTFVYLGANQDSWSETQGLGFSQGNVRNYNVGNSQAMFAGLGSSTAMYATASSAARIAGQNYGSKSVFEDAGITQEALLGEEEKTA